MTAVLPLELLAEKEWQAQVVQLARTLGYQHLYHTYNSRRSHSGFPDLVLVRDRVIYLELKTETGKLTAMQRQWLDALRHAGAEAYLARPRDLQPLADVLARPGRSVGSPLERSTWQELA